MSRYIDADAFLKSVKQKAYPQSGSVNENERKISLFGIMEILTAMPIADVVEVVHGKWIDTETGKCKCSHCKNTYKIKAKFLYSYCPNCSAIMDLQGEEDE